MCTAYGGGQGWYREVKNRAQELLHEELCGHRDKEAISGWRQVA